MLQCTANILNNEDAQSLTKTIAEDENNLKTSPFDENYKNLIIPNLWMETQFPIRFAEMKEKEIESLNNTEVYNLLLEEIENVEKENCPKLLWKQEYYYKYNKECKLLYII